MCDPGESLRTLGLSRQPISAAAAEIAFWRRFVAEHRLDECTTIWGRHRPADIVIATDASDAGVGAVTDSVRVALPLPTAALGTSSTHRELTAVLLTLQALAPLLAGKRVSWRIDNQAAVHILTTGSRVDDCQAVAASVFTTARGQGTTILPIWVPREENVEADALSKSPDRDDHQLSARAFRAVCVSLGAEPLVDLFAPHVSTKCESFASRSFSPRATIVDAFSVAWAPLGVVYIFPPVALIARVLNRLMQEAHVTAILVLPVWPSQPWWPLLCTDGVHARTEIQRTMRLRRSAFDNERQDRQFLASLGNGFRAAAFLWSSHPAPATYRRFCLHRFSGRPCPTGCP